MSFAEIRMPRSTVKARVSPRSIGGLILTLKDYLRDPAHRAMYPWADRFVMGMPLPPWQRPLVWTDEQKIRFIQSIWNDVDLGSYLINFNEEGFGYVEEGGHGQVIAEPFNDCVLDGQQRLSAIEDYVCNRIAVPDAEGTPRWYAELPANEIRRFGNAVFSRATISCSDEAVLRQVYDLRAYGGVSHEPGGEASVEGPVSWPERRPRQR